MICYEESFMYERNEIKEIIDEIVFLKKICYDEFYER